MPSTIRLHRVLRATPERVYRAFLDPDAMVKWLPQTDSPARFTTSTPALVAPTRCRSRTSPRARATPSAGSISNWCPTSEFATRDNV